MQEKTPNILLFTGSIAAMTGVTLGAFGAHGLKNIVSAELLGTFETAVRYQMYHAFGLIAAGLACRTYPPEHAYRFSRVGWLFGTGMILFCGSLYVLVLLDIPWLGAITPFGGIAFIAGWFMFALSIRKTG